MGARGEAIPEFYRPFLKAVARISYPPSLRQAGSGFYVGEGLVVTAGHIFSKSNDEGSLQKIDTISDPTEIGIHFGLDSSTRYVDRWFASRSKGGSSLQARLETWTSAGYAILEERRPVIEILGVQFRARDYALLRIREPWPEIGFEIADEGTFAKIKPGDEVFVFGSFEGRDPMFVDGAKLIDASGSILVIEPYGFTGFSGGPVIHKASGKVIAIHHGKNRDGNTLVQRIDYAFKNAAGRNKACDPSLRDPKSH